MALRNSAKSGKMYEDKNGCRQTTGRQKGGGTLGRGESDLNKFEKKKKKMVKGGGITGFGTRPGVGEESGGGKKYRKGEGSLHHTYLKKGKTEPEEGHAVHRRASWGLGRSTVTKRGGKDTRDRKKEKPGKKRKKEIASVKAA